MQALSEEMILTEVPTDLSILSSAVMIAFDLSKSGKTDNAIRISI